MAQSMNANSCNATMLIMGVKVGLENGEELDLAELLGKGGANEKT